MIFIFTFDLYTSAVIRRVVLSFVLTAMLVLLWPTARDAIEGGRRVALLVDNFERDVRAGEPIYRLAKRYAPFLHPSQDVLADELTLLQKARIGVFGIIRPNPAFREIDVPVIPSDVRLALGKWNCSRHGGRPLLALCSASGRDRLRNPPQIFTRKQSRWTSPLPNLVDVSHKLKIGTRTIVFQLGTTERPQSRYNDLG